MAGASVAGATLGYWLVNEAPMAAEGSRTNIQTTTETVLDASGRPLAGIAPQPLSDGTLGVPQGVIQPMWEIQAVSLFDSNLDPMVTLAIGDQSYTISDVLNQAGAGLGQEGSDIAMLDVTQAAAQGGTSDPIGALANAGKNAGSPANWEQALEEAIRACSSVNFFSRPGCIDRAQQQYCAPNNAWGQHRHCPSRQQMPNSGA